MLANFKIKTKNYLSEELIMNKVKLRNLVRSFKLQAKNEVQNAYRGNYTREHLLEEALYKACGEIKDCKEQLARLAQC